MRKQVILKIVPEREHFGEPMSVLVTMAWAKRGREGRQGVEGGDTAGASGISQPAAASQSRSVVGSLVWIKDTSIIADEKCQVLDIAAEFEP
ncbi:hypothetical protein RRG08_003587 [Elysia crispata]|uniref:Uncharacterized protein n=1 Tax=Elysia crispata TaxID=231223 RepID=A0AAE0YIM3_9GAST|nr:hypothetical protein RRG08_003587 [Elysia crispata]